MIVRRYSHLVRLTLGQGLRARPQICPTNLQFDKGLSMQAFCFHRVSRQQAALLFTLIDEDTQVFRDTFTEPVKTAVGMLPGT